MITAAAVPRPAATTLVVRGANDGLDGGLEGGLEVLMLKRSLQASFVPGAHVFPGGAVDESDGADAALALCDEAEADASARLHITSRARAHAVAALRECFEECGLWLGLDDGAGMLTADRLGALRQRLADGEDFAALTRDAQLMLSTRVLAPWSHWVTPIGLPKRFDTWFFIAPAPQGQEAQADGQEAIELVWISPREALARHAAGDFPIEFATQETLRSLVAFDTATSLLEHAHSLREVPVVHPRIARGAGGERRVLRAEHPAYAEVARLDPHGAGTALSVLVAGKPVALAPTVKRLTAPNPGPMTGPGTNSYLIGRNGVHAVIDPGPAIDAHVEAILAACDGRLEAILVTHTHPDHSPAAARLAAATGAQRIGLPAPGHGPQDTSFIADQVPADGECISVAGCKLVAIHTPGHASNHVCWWFAEEQLLFTGDHLMQGSTVVIDPPDGDMAAYLESLRGLAARVPDWAWLAPGHGFLVNEPGQVVARLIAHRERREAKVAAALQAIGPAEVAALVGSVYDDVAPALHGVAQRSLLAHLLKLRSEGRAAEDGGRWRSVVMTAG